MPDRYEASSWLEVFLTSAEKDHFAQWNEVVRDRSVINNIVDPAFTFMAQIVPTELAPNVLTLSGSFLLIQAAYFCEVYVEQLPKVAYAVSYVSIIAFWAFGGIDGKHARRTMNDTSLGELYKYVSDIVSSIALTMVMCALVLEARDYETTWYCVQISQLVLLMKHYSGFLRDSGLRYLLIGPGELVTGAAGVLLIAAFFGLEWLRLLYSLTVGLFCKRLQSSLGLPDESYLAQMYPARATYLIVFVLLLIRIICSPVARREGSKAWTRFALVGVLLLRAVSAILKMLLFVHGPSASVTTSRDVIFDGLFMGLITSDLIVAKMAGRDLHSLVVLMAGMVVMPHTELLILLFVVFYYFMVFADIMNYMNLPLFVKVTNVYCDGVYDLCHIGHKNLFRKALTLGNRLFVGVVGDEDASAYKRPPIMSASEREQEVMSCQGVTKVISNSPCFGMTLEFIKHHRIHLVAYGAEYQERYPNPDDDPYYKVPRKLGMAIPMARTNTMSTSDLIKRIQDREGDAKKSPT